MIKNYIKIIFIKALCVALLTTIASCGDTVAPADISEKKYVLMRVTYYTTDRYYGNKVAWSKVKVAKKGTTVAAHPRLPFGTKVVIPQLNGVVGTGQFVVQDRGTAVTRKVASRGKTDVLDVFVDCKQELKRLARTMPGYMKVYVILNK